MVHEVLLDTKAMSLDSSNNARRFARVPRPRHFPCDIDQRVFLLGGFAAHNGNLIAVSRLAKGKN